MNTHCFCFTYLNNVGQLLYISLNYFMVSTVKFWSKIYLKLICLCCSYSSCFLFIFMWIFNSFSTISSPNNIICPLYSILAVLEIMFISLAFFFYRYWKLPALLFISSCILLSPSIQFLKLLWYYPCLICVCFPMFICVDEHVCSHLSSFVMWSEDNLCCYASDVIYLFLLRQGLFLG